MVPPTLPTAEATRCSSVAPATVTVGPSRNGVPGCSGRERSRVAAARLAAPQLVQQVGGLRQRLPVTDDIGDRKAGRRQQAAEHGDIQHDRDQRRTRQGAGDGVCGVHGFAVFFGSIRASIWKRSPGSEAERVVGA